MLRRDARERTFAGVGAAEHITLHLPPVSATAAVRATAARVALSALRGGVVVLWPDPEKDIGIVEVTPSTFPAVASVLRTHDIRYEDEGATGLFRVGFRRAGADPQARSSARPSKDLAAALEAAHYWAFVHEHLAAPEPPAHVVQMAETFLEGHLEAGGWVPYTVQPYRRTGAHRRATVPEHHPDQ